MSRCHGRVTVVSRCHGVTVVGAPFLRRCAPSHRPAGAAAVPGPSSSLPRGPAAAIDGVLLPTDAAFDSLAERDRGGTHRRPDLSCGWLVVRVRLRAIHCYSVSF